MKTNLEIIKQAYADFSQGNIPGILDALNDNIEWELPKSAHVDFAGVFKGKEQVLNFFQHVAAQNDFTEFSTDTFIADGDHVVVLGHLTASAKPSGKISSNKWAHYWLLKDGKAVNHYEYADTAEIRDAFSN
jgi:ketosteroid isomerase-like protein